MHPFSRLSHSPITSPFFSQEQSYLLMMPSATAPQGGSERRGAVTEKNNCQNGKNCFCDKSINFTLSRLEMPDLRLPAAQGLTQLMWVPLCISRQNLLLPQADFRTILCTFDKLSNSRCSALPGYLYPLSLGHVNVRVG